MAGLSKRSDEKPVVLYPRLADNIIQPVTDNVGLIIRGSASGQTAEIQQWQNSAGSTKARVYQNGDIQTWGNIGFVDGVNGGRIDGPGDGSLQLNTFSSNPVIVGAGSKAPLYASGFTSLSNNAQIINNEAVSSTVLTIRGILNQTGDLQQWQGNDGTVISKVLANGSVQFGSGTGAFKQVINGINSYISIQDSAGNNYGIRNDLSGTIAGLSAIGGWFQGIGVRGNANGTTDPIFTVLNSTQTNNPLGLGGQAFTVKANNSVFTYNNTLDDGSGKLTTLTGFIGKTSLTYGVYLGYSPTPIDAPLNARNDQSGAYRPGAQFQNLGGGAGAGIGIDFATYGLGTGQANAASLRAMDNNYSADFSFQTKNYGAATNPLVERFFVGNSVTRFGTQAATHNVVVMGYGKLRFYSEANVAFFDESYGVRYTGTGQSPLQVLNSASFVVGNASNFNGADLGGGRIYLSSAANATDTYLTRTNVGTIGGSVQAFAISNIATEPSAPTSGGVLYVYGGALKYIGSSGTRTTIGPA